MYHDYLYQRIDEAKYFNWDGVYAYHSKNIMVLQGRDRYGEWTSGSVVAGYYDFGRGLVTRSL
jgi:hypothetical protein